MTRVSCATFLHILWCSYDGVSLIISVKLQIDYKGHNLKNMDSNSRLVIVWLRSHNLWCNSFMVFVMRNIIIRALV